MKNTIPSHTKTAARLGLACAIGLCGACSHAVRPDIPAAPLLAIPTTTPTPPTERLRQVNAIAQVWSTQGTVRWVRPGEEVQERRFLWRESSGAWALGVRMNDGQPAGTEPAGGDAQGEGDWQGDEGGPALGQPATGTAFPGGEGGSAASGAASAGLEEAMTSPLAGAMASERGVFLVHANGQADPITDDAMTALIHSLWGPLPVDQLRAWVLALPSKPGDAFTYYPNGRPASLAPQEGEGWSVAYRAWMDSTPPFPQNVLIKGPDKTEVEIRFELVSLRQPIPATPGLSF